MKIPRFSLSKKNLVYPVRMTVAAVLALLVARTLGFREIYWAPISALVVVQSDFGSSLLMSWHRFVGTALGVSVGALLAETLGHSTLVFGCGVLAVGLMSVALRLDRPANRFAAIALTIVLLVGHAEPAWIAAFHRLIEVSAGILAGLVLTAVWPEQQTKNTKV